METIVNSNEDKLQVQLDRLAVSMRFPMLKNLALIRFSEGDARLSQFSELTLEELVLRGAEMIREQFGRDGSLALLSLLEKLLEGEPAPILAGNRINNGPVEISSKIKKITPKLGTPRFIGSDVEAKLVALVQKVKGAPSFEKHVHRTLAEFWPKGAVRSPFEECLSFKQVVSLNIDSLLKKRSIGPEKLDAIMQAMQAFIENLESLALKARDSSHVAANRNTNFRKYEAESVSWDLSGFRDGIGLLALRSVWQELEAGSIVQKILSEAAKAGLAKEFWCIWQAASALLLKSEQLSETKEFAASSRKIMLFLKRDFPEVYSSWNTMLCVPLVSVEQVAQRYINRQGNQYVQFEIICAFFLAIGGRPVKIFDTIFPSYWSNLHAGAEEAVRIVAKSQPKNSKATSQSSVKTVLRQLLPQLSPKDLNAVVAMVKYQQSKKKK